MLSVEYVPHFLTYLGISIMKKSKLLLASVLVSSILVSGYGMAGPSDKKKLEPFTKASVQSTPMATHRFLDF
jgi:hypothetical protein